uniref:Threonylcarbamoyl-AMP synthase n=1 Tax=Pipistrellus kuhlii TaxID=59472 RepID=A0A7J7UMC5_PIPKU|nr:hypothetical protein mPipKuh1_008759 [Pipistrellus kuhlii]
MAKQHSGSLVVIPTDTLYGLACLVRSSMVLDAVYHLKGCSEAKLLAVCLGHVVDVYRCCHVKIPEGLLKDLLPGPVTLVTERLEELSKDLNPFTSPVGIWIPDHALMQDLAQMFGEPLALTSANFSSQPTSLNVEEFQDLWPPLSLVIDGGPMGMARAPSVASAQLWLTCLCLENLVSFLQAVPWKTLWLSSKGNMGCSLTGILLRLGRQEDPGTDARSYMSFYWWMPRPHLQRPLGHSITSLTFKAVCIYEHCNQAPE